MKKSLKKALFPFKEDLIMEKDTEIGFITKKDCEFIGTALGDAISYLSRLLAYKLGHDNELIPVYDLEEDAIEEIESALKLLNPVYEKFVKFDKNK